jgi:signal transduction histidine kinase
MLMSTSSDFLALCQEQIALLTQGFGASLSIVYLTQELVETPADEAQLIPVVVYPEATVYKQIQLGHVLALPNRQEKLLTPALSPDSTPAEEYLLSHNQIVLPLIYEGLMMGLLVTNREDRVWNEREQGEIQRIAKTITLACIVDQRRGWLEKQLQQQLLLQAEQRDLFDNLLHQFRNPLTAIRTFGKLLFKRLRSTDQNQAVATSIIGESDRLQELLQQFEQVIDLTDADLETLETLQKDAQPILLLPGSGDQNSACSLGDLFSPLLLSFQAIAQERNLQLITDIPTNLPQVVVNFKALQEVLSNLIDNALKYTPAGGKVIIRLGLRKANFQGIEISDTGPGIPAQDLEHLGERYYRGRQAQTEIPGTGLGIAIAKQLIKQMQGEIEVFSPAINLVMNSPNTSGTTFIIWLPESESH